MLSDEIWLHSTSFFVLAHLPPAPARVIELGCGELGGHVPVLRRGGYEAVGIDPRAPDGSPYVRALFEEYGAGEQATAVVASLSLHHVADLGVALDRVHDLLVPGGTVVILEWAREQFDEATARWCFDRLPGDRDNDDGALSARRTERLQSGLPWDRFCGDWADSHGIHSASVIRRELDARFTMTHTSWGPYY